MQYGVALHSLKPLIRYLILRDPTGLDAFSLSQLHSRASDLVWADLILTKPQVDELWELVLRTNPSLELACQLAMMWEVRDMGIMGLLLYCCENYGELIELNRTYLTHQGTKERAVHFTRGKETWVEIGHESDFLTVPLFTQIYLACSGVFAVRQVIDGQDGLLRVELPLEKPDHSVVNILQQQIGAPVLFKSSTIRLVYDNNLMARPLKGKDPVLRALLLNHLESDGTLRASAHPDNIMVDVRILIRDLPKDSNLTAERVADSLGLSRRTLDRRLSESGVTFNELKEDVLKSMAIDQLQKGVAIRDISRELGFSNLSSFSRAFKRWTNMSPRGLKSPRGSLRPLEKSK